MGKCLAQIADPEFVPNKSNILKWHYAIQCAQYSHSAWADCPDDFSLPSESTVVTLDETIKLLPWKGFGVERKKNARGALRYNYAMARRSFPGGTATPNLSITELRLRTAGLAQTLFRPISATP